MLDLNITGLSSEKQTRTKQVRHSHVLTADDARLFAAALDQPPAPTPRALKAAASYRRRVAHAD